MGKVFGIDLGTTYSCIAYIDENGKPVVLKNAEGDLTTPSAVFFETQTDVTVGSAAKESAKMYPEQVVTFIKRSIGQPGFSLNLNGIDMKPEEISSYILKKVVKDAEDTLRMEGKLGDDEQIHDVVITCPAYFGVTERDATKAAGVIAGLNVLAIINEPTAAAITYGVTDDSQNKTVLVYDLGGGTFDITMINIKPGEIRVICTGGDHNLGGKDWDDRVLMYLAEQYQSETGTPDNILEDAETLQELSLAAERAKKLLSAKEKAPVAVNYMGERVRVELTREKFDELTEDLLTRTIDLTREMFKEAEKKGFTQSDVSEILLVGGSSKMPQVMSRVKSEFGIETKMFDPDESVAKGAAIYANKMSEFNIVLEEIAKQQGKSVEEVKEQVDKGQMDIQKEAKKANIQMRGGRLPGEDVKIINVSSRSFGTCAYDETDQLKLFNIIIKNAELPATGTNSFYPRQNNQRSVRFQVMECLASDEKVDPELGKEIGTAELTLPAGVTLDTEIQVTFRLDESGLLHLHAKEMKDGREVDAEFQTTKMDKAVELLRQAKQKYSEKALEEAERLVKEAKAYWPNHADVLSLEKTIQDERKQAADTIAAIMKDIQDKKMYAAQTKIDQAKANGFSIDPSVASKVTAVLKEVESQLAIMRNASGDEAFTIAMKLTELIADSDELNQSLKKFPPDEVPAVSSKRVGDEITLTWKPSPSIGEITYVVVRKENTYPNGPTDGSTVYNGKELAYTDSNAPKNTVLYYSVFAVRIGVHSKATRLDEAVAIVGKVTNLKAIGGNEMVTLSWTKASTVTEIRLYKYCGYERPQDDNLEKMFGLKDKDTLKRNLAVVINKVDIPTLEEKIGETAAQQYLAENAKTCKSYMDARDAVCRNFLEEYGAGNFVRTAEAKFKTVRYFTCSALGHNHEGQPYEGKNVVDPVMWLLQQADSSIKAE